MCCRCVLRVDATYRMMKPVEQVTAWLYGWRAPDCRSVPPAEGGIAQRAAGGRGRLAALEDCCFAGCRAGRVYARNLMLEALDERSMSFRRTSASVCGARVDGKSFKQLAEETGESGNTLSRSGTPCCTAQRLQQMRKVLVRSERKHEGKQGFAGVEDCGDRDRGSEPVRLRVMQL